MKLLKDLLSKAKLSSRQTPQSQQNEEYTIWLSYNNYKEALLLPVNPETIEITSGNDTSTHEISKLGQVSTIQSPKLRTFSFESEFPKHAAFYPIGSKVVGPQKSIRLIESWMQKGHPLRLLVAGDMFKLTFPVTIKNFTYSQEAGHDCVYFKLELEEYRFYAARKVKS